VLTQIGDILLPNFDTLGINYQLLSGVFFHVLLGMLLGFCIRFLNKLSHAVFDLCWAFLCFILWLVIGIIVGWMTGDEARGVFHSWLWLLSCFSLRLLLSKRCRMEWKPKQKSTKIALPKD